jgi:hypothetical protein
MWGGGSKGGSKYKASTYLVTYPLLTHESAENLAHSCFALGAQSFAFLLLASSGHHPHHFLRSHRFDPSRCQNYRWMIRRKLSFYEKYSSVWMIYGPGLHCQRHLLPWS